MSLFGLSIDEWRNKQIESSKSDALANVLSLLAEIQQTAGPEWIHLCTPKEIESQFDRLPSDTSLPLYGVPYAVKDNIDVQGLPTTAACPTFAHIATEDAHIVSLLREAGAIVMGKTNLDQFATGLVGTRSPYGIPKCVFSDKHVSGGSSSGSAVAVANGSVPFSLGTDTAGSGRVPAALNNLIGVKPTVGIWSTTGIVPACRSLDTASVFAQGIRDAQRVLKICIDYDELNAYSRPMPERPVASFGRRPVIGVPTNLEFFDDTENAELFEKYVSYVSAQGVEIRKVDCSDLFALAKLLYEGPWVAERRWAVSEQLKLHGPESLDPTVRQIVMGADKLSAVDAFDKEYTRQEIKKKAQKLMKSLDALLMPTCPLNPRVSEVQSEPILVNSKQGYYTNFVNLADFAALAIPSKWRKDGLPVGVTFIGPAFSDYALLDLASRLMPASRKVGHINREFDSTMDKVDLESIPPSRTVPLAVIGAHLSGMPLNWQLRKAKATLNKRTWTSSSYRLYALDTVPPKPGIVRCESGRGSCLAVEVWDMPYETFGEFVNNIPAPLGIGKIELEGGQWVSGFVWDGSGPSKEITEYGGWKNYISSTATSSQRPFTKVLVANRGEIAVRIIRTLRRLGITSVAVYSEPDKDSEHVKLADEAVNLGGTTASQTYLAIRKILDAAKSTSAEAIIPGYGFLSENADFSDLCEAEGIIFVGPSGTAMRELGLKHSARRIAENAGVPLVPGTGLLETIDEALASVPRIGGYPIMLKSTAGGGGIGLQRVDNDDDLKRAFTSVKRQGEAYFGDSGVFMESFIENARHVEVQVFGDGQGHAIALGERDCSLQRRNQKVIEETPAPGIPAETVKDLHKSAVSLAASMKYKCAGTVEYIYDDQRNRFYFLEVNARLQVEHPITELVTGLDLVEWMLLVAANRPPFSDDTVITPKGAAMEARLYAENPVKDFRPSPGQITELSFPSWARVDGWARKGTNISSEYDPTIAKIIVYGKDRAEALENLQRALAETVVGGIVSNLDYLRSIAGSSMFGEAKMYTKVLDSYEYKPKVVEIVAPGTGSSIQDWPGRKGLWHIGVPPSGPMDSFSHRTANALVGNELSAAALETTLSGPTLLFHEAAVVAITGGDALVTVNDQEVKQWQAIEVPAGAKLKIGKLTTGCRAYLAIHGGIDVPKYLGSRSTFAAGNLGGHNGRELKFGDVLGIQPFDASSVVKKSVPPEFIPKFGNHWEIAVTVGPHGAPDFFAPEFVEEFFESNWKVHYNSNRFGVRLVGPKAKWARKDGGDAGLHPSNTHDYVYSLGAINFTGNEPVVITCDGPSLGGFVCLAVIVEAELWKLGQVKPGDTVRFSAVDVDEAKILGEQIESYIDGEYDTHQLVSRKNATSAILHHSLEPLEITYRQAGDKYILVEYGENKLDLTLRYRVHLLVENLKKSEGVVEMSPGVRSVNIEYDPAVISQSYLVSKLRAIEDQIQQTSSWTVPSRVIRLPMVFEDSRSLAAVARYAETIRSEAPWLPNNVDFIASTNALKDRNEIRDLMYSASFMVMGLGDVYLGAPCAVPLDPRHRLLGTKYNPSRSWTPNGAVGLGGSYMCIYAMDSPGGYQLIGRTVPIWDKLCLNEYSHGDRPWLLRPFDRIEFYPISEKQLESLEQQVYQGEYHPHIEDSSFDFGDYSKFLERNAKSIDEHTQHLQSRVEKFAKVIAESDQAIVAKASEEADLGEYSEDAVMVYAEITGRFWKSLVSEGDIVASGDHLVVLEAMKTEMFVTVPDLAKGKVAKLVHKNGDLVDTGDLIAIIEPVTE